MLNIIEGVKKYSKTDRLSYICGESTLSYKDLEIYSNIVGNYILESYEQKVPVLIYVNKDRMFLPCMIGILKSGRAYVPMDISFPENRIKDIIDSIKPNLIFDLSGESYIEDLLNTLNIDGIEVVDNVRLERMITDNLDSDYSNEIDSSNWVNNDENSYILFTSGSTGKPKGVQISTYNLDSFVRWMSPILGLDGSSQVVMDQPAYSFDLSVSQLYPGIQNGATLFALPKKVVADFRSLFLEFKRSNMKVWVSTPSFIGMCLADNEFSEMILPDLEKMLFIGEVLPVEVARLIRERFPRVEIINGYGPTEATVGISHVVITDEHINSKKSLPVGVPMPNCKILIVDEQGRELPNGEKGEIVIVGPSVSKGYFNDDEKTKKSFYIEKNGPAPEFDIQTNIDELRFRAYKTGDLGYIAEDGNIRYSGRIDFQIKLNGYRIEIEDIENNIRKIKDIVSTCVLPVYKDEKIAHLKAFIQLSKKRGLEFTGDSSPRIKNDLKTMIDIKKELSEYIPEYMIPRAMVFVDEMPMNTNGKIDRKVLKEMI